MIINWCGSTGKGDAPARADDDLRADATREHLSELLETSSVRALRSLTARSPSARALFGEIDGSVSRLLDPSLIERCYSDTALYEDVVATILNVSTDNSCKVKILEGNTSASVVSFLSDALRSRSGETRGQAAAALSALSTVDSNKAVIGESGAIKPLIKLLEEGHPLASSEAASAILNLCTLIENRERALSHGAVAVAIGKIVSRAFVDEALEILARFSGHQRAVEEMEERGMIPILLGMMARDDVGERSKENCVVIVYAICYSDPTKLGKISEVACAREALSRVSKTGTARAKRKATGLLERMSRFGYGFGSHTA